MHITHIHKQDETGSASGNSAYDTPPGDIGLPAQILSKIGPVTQSQTKACQLDQSTQEAWTKAIKYVQHK